MKELPEIKKLVAWLQIYDYAMLRNEAEVETKFIHPLFALLGYTDATRYDKQPVVIHSFARQTGRLPEADQVYYSTVNPKEQNENTCLVVVEAKKTDHSQIDQSDLLQAQKYGNVLKPVLLVLTNGKELQIFRRESGKKDELVLHVEKIDDLKQLHVAENLYHLLNFTTVKNIKDTDTLAYARQVRLDQLLQANPQIQALLEEGDFPFSEPERLGRNITVARPKVKISCKLPLALEEGNCVIKFSDIRRRGLEIHLGDEVIRNKLLVGLHTPLDWETRNFIEILGPDLYRVRLGQIITDLTKAEVNDLCDCIDIVFSEYKRGIINTKAIMGILNTRYIIENDSPAFYLLSVSRRLWHLMVRFAQEFHLVNGPSQWNIFLNDHLPESYFDIRPIVIVGGEHLRQAEIYPRISKEQSDFIDLHLLVAGSEYWIYEKYTGKAWKESIGRNGFWTLPFTLQWIGKEFIPKVISYYQAEPVQSSEIYILEKVYTSLEEIAEPSHLTGYLDDIWQWIFEYKANNIPATVLRDYYEVFTKLAHKVDPEKIDTGYLSQKLKDLDNALYGERRTRQLNYTEILESLDKIVQRIKEVDYEYHGDADSITRVFSMIARKATFIEVSQSEINEAKQVLLPLWEESLFEKRWDV